MTLVLAGLTMAAVAAMRLVAVLEEASTVERSLDHEPEVGTACRHRFTEQIQR
jgi:hypothetical protein